MYLNLEPKHSVLDALADVHSHGPGRIAQQDDKLLAAVTGRDVVVAHGGDDRGADNPQHLVPDRVSVAVVEVLEPVDVDHQHADCVVGPPAAREQPA